MRRAAKRDANEGPIIDALLAVGAYVQQADFVDLVVGFRSRNYLLEIKQENGRLTPRQEKLLAEWPGQYAIVRTPEEALRAVGAIGRGEEAGC